MQNHSRVESRHESSEASLRDFESTLTASAELLRRISASSLALNPTTQILEELRTLEATLHHLWKLLHLAPTQDREGLKRRLTNLRRAVTGYDWRLRSLAEDVHGSLVTLRGAAIDAGSYQPGSPRRSTAGSWMNVRSSP